MGIIYKTGIVPETDEIIGIYKSSGINRPIDDRNRIEQMYAQSNLIITAWQNDKLIGIARSLTDNCYCCYLSDLAVSAGYQKQGIGKKLVNLTKDAVGDKTTLILVSAPDAVDFYTNIGLDRIDTAFLIRRKP